MIENEKSEETLITEELAALDKESVEANASEQEVELTPEQIRIAELEAANKALLDSLKNTRAKKAIDSIESPTMDDKVEEPAKSDIDEIDRRITERFKKEEAEVKKKNKVQAFELFWGKFKEFHPENDITGVRHQNLLSALSRINMSTSSSVEDFYKDIVDAAKLSGLVKEQPRQGTSILNKEASTASVSSTPKSTTPNPLSAAQEKIRLERGWTVEQFLERKAKHPSILP